MTAVNKPGLVAKSFPVPVESPGMNQGTVEQTLDHAYRLLQQGHRDKAEHIARRVLQNFPNNINALNILGLVEQSRRQFKKARTYYQKALKQSPGNLHFLNNIGWVERELKNYSKAEACFTRALKLDPGFYFARQNLAVVFQDQRKFTRAKQLYREVLLQKPDLVDALANLSNILEQEHETEAAESLAKRALAINSEHHVARLTLANIAARNKSFEQVIALLGPMLNSPKRAPMDRAMMGSKCAHAYQQLGQYKQAFSLYESANQLLHMASRSGMNNPDLMYSPAAFESIQNAIAEFSFSRESEETKSPVFLIGFPRSGTTLLDQILSSHSQITVLEEKPNLAHAFKQFPANEEGLDALQNASEAILQKLRRTYWGNVKRELGTKKTTPIVIDKLPLNAFALLHISKMFPNAKIIVALRDPRDCVFSSFQYIFNINPATFQLLQLETAVSLYDRVMNVISGVRETDALAMHFVRYENVIENFDDEIAALIEFLELEWEDALSDYQATAKSRDVRTPSASQVIQPLYTSSIGKWRHYEEWIGTRFDPLKVWVERWGYPL